MKNFELNVISIIHDLTSILNRCNDTTSMYTLHFNIRRKLFESCGELAHGESPKHRFNPKSGFPKYKLSCEDTDEDVISAKLVKDRLNDRRKDDETMETPETNSETETEPRDNSAAALAHFFKFLSDTFDD